MTASFRHEIRVRYGDCDMQGIVFNARYLAYVDDAVDVWLQHALGRDYLQRFEYVVKKAAVEWFGPARSQDVLTLQPRVARWGASSSTVRVAIAAAERAVADAELVLVAVGVGTHSPTRVPDDVRAALGPAD